MDVNTIAFSTPFLIVTELFYTYFDNLWIMPQIVYYATTFLLFCQPLKLIKQYPTAIINLNCNHWGFMRRHFMMFGTLFFVR